VPPLPPPTHVPAEQLAPLWHLLPHEPQLAASLIGFVHTSLHASWPLGHAHMPATHDSPAGQPLLHAPQFCTLVVRSTQL
jgi:hypothetical protein